MKSVLLALALIFTFLVMDLLELLLALAVIFAAVFVFGREHLPGFGMFFNSTTSSSEKEKSK